MTETAFRSDEAFTQEQFRRWLDGRPQWDVNHYELLDGRIAMTPPAGWPHGRIEVKLARMLDEHASRQNLGIVLGSSAGFDLPSGDTVEPDVSFISDDRLAVGPAPEPHAFLRVVPSLVVEILSPATAKRDRTEKKAIYERNRVAEYWLVDPERKEVTVFRLAGNGYDAGTTIYKGLICSAVLPDVAVDVGDLFTL